MQLFLPIILPIYDIPWVASWEDFRNRIAFYEESAVETGGFSGMTM
jgi:hypothetical protein